ILRDRLTRRGVALGTGTLVALVAEPALAALPEPLATTTSRLALQFAAEGTTAGAVPAAVASLAEGVLKMLAVAQLKFALIAPVPRAGGGGRPAGLAWAVGPEGKAGGQPPGAARPSPVAAVKAPASATPEPSTPAPVQVRGIVVDEAGGP